MIKVKISRKTATKNETKGDLKVIDASGKEIFSCKTLELVWNNNLNDISCIPIDKYTCVYNLSPKFGYKTYEVINVPQRTGIRFHSANYYTELLGCIALGNGYSDINSDGEDDITNSKNTINNFENIFTSPGNTDDKVDFELEITNSTVMSLKNLFSNLNKKIKALFVNK